ncbi:MAG: hypothetical protein WBR26_11570 [Candidatus Acidiferrum sp.]
MPQRLFDKGEINVSSHEVGSQTMLQSVWVTFFSREASDVGSCLEQSEELRSVEFPAFLARKQNIRPIVLSLS